MSKKDKDRWRKMSRTRRDICVEVWRVVAFGGRIMPIHSNLDGREPRMEISNPLSSLAGEPCWSNPKEPINADCAGQPPRQSRVEKGENGPEGQATKHSGEGTCQ